MSYKKIVTSIEGGLAKLTLNAPPLNIMDIEMLTEIQDFYKELVEADVSALLIRGEGKVFSAGASVEDHFPEKVETMIRTFHEGFRILDSFDGAVVASVHGSCLGGGMELVSRADIVIATQTAVFGQPEIKLGVFPPVACAAFERLIGEKRAMELILTGDVIDADEAKRIGFINRVVPDDELGSETEKLVAKLLKHSRPVLRMTKRAIRESRDKPVIHAINNAEEMYLEELMNLKDPMEGLTSFVEKRKPVWKHE
ncbi:MAG: enoyl-CoA hydratase-related protein [Planctomycetes bacterium]|nr:enoyl-CoA hydratase-related protein [Planctomycetota bacterium]